MKDQHNLSNLSAFTVALFLLGAFAQGCSSSDGLNLFGFSGATGAIGIGDDADGDGVPDTVLIDGAEVPVIPPVGNTPGCVDLDGDGSCSVDEPAINPPDDDGNIDPIIPKPEDCEDPDNDGICGSNDLQPDTGILLRVRSSNISDPSGGVSSADGKLTFNNGSSTTDLFEASRFNNTPQTFCFLLNARVGSNEFVGLSLQGSKDDKLELEVYKGDSGKDLLAECNDDPLSFGTLACSGSVIRVSGPPNEVDISCDL